MIGKSNAPMQLELTDLISLYLSILNLNENVSQSSVQDVVNAAVKRIEEHLIKQDERLDNIERMIYDNARD